MKMFVPFELLYDTVLRIRACTVVNATRGFPVSSVLRIV